MAKRIRNRGGIRLRVALIAVLALSFAFSPPMSAAQIGGYVYNGESRFVDNVYNFIKHFSYQQ
ncbi:MAG: hypothetical protein ABJC61_06410, partial [Acidobacteriota bacterium]